MSQSPSGSKNDVGQIESRAENDATAPVISRASAICNQLISAILTSFGGCVMGSILSWTSPALSLLKDLNNTEVPLHVDDDEGSLISSVAAVGAIFGALPAGVISGMLGRKWTLLVSSIPWIVSSLMIVLGNSVLVLCISRFIAGIVIGIVSTVIPSYIAEIVEPSIRGELGTLFELFLTLGILFSNSLGLFKNYQILAIAGLALSLLYFIGLMFIPPSPTDLMAKNKEDKAVQTLRKLRGDEHNIKGEMKEIVMQLRKEKEEKGSLKDVFLGYNRKALLICLCLMFFMQHCGINIVVFFSVKVFQDVNGIIPPNISAVVVALFQVLSTIASALLVDRAGRRILLLISAFAMFVCLSILGYYFLLKDQGDDVMSISWIPFLSVIFFIVAFHLGFGPVPWILTGELFAEKVKSYSLGISGAFHWVQTFIATQFFVKTLKVLGTAYTYWSLAGVCLLAFVFTLIFVPETKGKSLQQIQNEIMGNATLPQETTDSAIESNTSTRN